MAAYEELGYAFEKFGQAINDLADRPGKPQDRLRAARLRLFTVRSELPEGELRDIYVGIRSVFIVLGGHWQTVQKKSADAGDWDAEASAPGCDQALLYWKVSSGHRSQI